MLLSLCVLSCVQTFQLGSKSTSIFYDPKRPAPIISSCSLCKMYFTVLLSGVTKKRKYSRNTSQFVCLTVKPLTSSQAKVHACVF